MQQYDAILSARTRVGRNILILCWGHFADNLSFLVGHGRMEQPRNMSVGTSDNLFSPDSWISQSKPCPLLLFPAKCKSSMKAKVLFVHGPWPFSFSFLSFWSTCNWLCVMRTLTFFCCCFAAWLCGLISALPCMAFQSIMLPGSRVYEIFCPKWHNISTTC